MKADQVGALWLEGRPQLEEGEDDALLECLGQDTQCGSTLHSRYLSMPKCKSTAQQLPGRVSEDTRLSKTEEQLVSQGSRWAGLPVHSPRAFLWFDVQFVVIDVNFGDVHFKEIGL